MTRRSPEAGPTGMVKAGIRRALAGLYHARRGWASRLRGKVVILAYHRVLPAHELARTAVQPGMYVLDTTFAAQMQFLKEHFVVLSLPQLLAAWREGGLNGAGPYCAVTFDDGWLDNYVHAYPVLQRLAIPATVFLATGFVGTDRWFWPDRLAHLLREAGRQPSAGLAGGACSERAIDETIERWKGLRPGEIDRRLDEMGRALAVETRRERIALSWSEVAEMSRGGISFGSHSTTRAILTRLDAEELGPEVEGSLADLQRPDVKWVSVFCYPNGGYSDRVVERVKAAGYAGAVTADFGWEAPAPRDMFRLRRIGVHQDICGTIPLFAFHMSGLNQILAGVTRRRSG